MILVVDNYDSFTYNLVHLVEAEAEVRVARNDAVTVAEVAALRPAGILLSPGPGHPAGAGVCAGLVRQLGASIPILGVCLGHQVLAEVFGARIVRSAEPVHGKPAVVRHDGRTVFEGVGPTFQAVRYHSLCVDPESVTAELEVSAWTDDGVVMGLRHRAFPIEGLQFHPESVLTTEGPRIVRNWLHRCLSPAGPEPT